ncbi:hypothetical protein BY996DRAFT_8529847 [Phakopsora pachyrhizi]|nr:hypothetical protein BY996DRAFT_8529847 [Phakopsora pachyrhizi]
MVPIRTSKRSSCVSIGSILIILIILIKVSAQDFAQESTSDQSQSLNSDSRQHQPSDSQQQSNTLSSTTRTREQEGILLYNRAQRLLNHVQSYSNLVPPRTPLHPPSSVFSPSSYTPLLDRLSWLDRGLFSFIFRLIRNSSDRSDPNPLTNSNSNRPSNPRKRSRLLAILTFPRRVLELFSKTSDRFTSGARKVGSTKILTQREAEDATLRAAGLLERSVYEFGNPDAGIVLGNLLLWGGTTTNLISRDPQRSMKAFKWVADLTGNATAQANLAFLYATGYAGVLGDNLTYVGDQSTALLYYTFAALGGDYSAEMSLGYRHWVGIGTTQSCREALPFYKSAADKSMQTFNSGPPGGRHMPPLKVRLSDRDGGIYGPGASVVSTGNNKNQHSPQHPATVQEWNDVLEFYQFHAERGDATFMFRLGRIYYYGFGTAGDDIRDFALTNGRQYLKALKWFNRIARTVWPRDPEAATSPNGQAFQNKQGQWQTPVVGGYDASKDVKLTVEETQSVAAGLAAGFLGRLYLRGEGVPRNNAKAFLWFSRGATQGDRESQNGLGIMYRDGLGVQRDIDKAVNYFQAAATAELPEAHVNLGKYYLGIDDYVTAISYFDSAIKHGDNYQSYYYLAEINSQQLNRPDLCPIAVAFYKRVAERGDWFQEVFWKAEKAWSDGDEATAFLGFWMMAERGYEVAQNNMAYILDRHKKRIIVPSEWTYNNSTDRLALTYWTRSAAQDNIDALVKMGDYYLNGYGTLSGKPQPEKAAACYQTATNTHHSAMAMWNLGWMHENGIGVSQDYHLAKRFYDLALETNSEASLPVTLSLAKLYARSFWDYIFQGDSKYLLVFAGSGDENLGNSWWSLRKVRDEITRRWLGISPPPGANDNNNNNNNDHNHHHTDSNQANNPQTGDGSATATTSGGGGKGETESSKFDVTAAQRALQQDDDPVEWARNARERERGYDGEEGEDEDDLFLAGGASDDFLETLGILFLCLGVGAFVFLRQQREQQQVRLEAERQNEEVNGVVVEEQDERRGNLVENDAMVGGGEGSVGGSSSTSNSNVDGNGNVNGNENGEGVFRRRNNNNNNNDSDGEQ